MPRTLLVHFISDFLREESLQTEVIEHPTEAMKRYGLTRGQIQILLSQSKVQLKNAIIEEVAHATRAIVRKYPEL